MKLLNVVTLATCMYAGLYAQQGFLVSTGIAGSWMPSPILVFWEALSLKRGSTYISMYLFISDIIIVFFFLTFVQQPAFLEAGARLEPGLEFRILTRFLLARGRWRNLHRLIGITIRIHCAIHWVLEAVSHGSCAVPAKFLPCVIFVHVYKTQQTYQENVSKSLFVWPKILDVSQADKHDVPGKGLSL